MPGKSASRRTLADIFQHARDHFEGMEPLRQLVEIELKRKPEDFGLLKMMGEILFYQDEHKDALPWLQKAIKQKPRDDDLNAELGMSLYKMKRYGEALPYLENTLKRYPKDYDQQMMVGYAFFKMDRRNEAAVHLQAALTHDVDFESYSREITELALAGLTQKPGNRRPAP